MGVDACIYVKTKNGAEPMLERGLPHGYELKLAGKWAPSGATHEVDQAERYYGPGYERGSWPNLCAALMLLHASPDVETVWYSGDSGSEETEEPFTQEKVLAFSAHFMKHGERPYRWPIRRVLYDA